MTVDLAIGGVTPRLIAPAFGVAFGLIELHIFLREEGGRLFTRLDASASAEGASTLQGGSTQVGGQPSLRGQRFHKHPKHWVFDVVHRIEKRIRWTCGQESSL